MKLFKKGLIIISLLLVLTATPALAGSSVTIHFFVVPTVPAAGLDMMTAMTQFKLKLAELAGGYTELGPSTGGVFFGGAVTTEHNISFLVSASKDLTTDLEALIPQYFDQAQPFILTWLGVVNR